jgi:pimeloyl-ACP methyl ester carboxylesterase
MEPMANQISNSEFVQIDGAGHMTPIENSQMVNVSIKNFLVKNKI